MSERGGDRTGAAMRQQTEEVQQFAARAEGGALEVPESCIAAGGGDIMTKQKTLEDIKGTFGFVPGFFEDFKWDELALSGGWELFKKFELSETNIPLKYKHLIAFGGSRGGQVPVLHEIPHGRGGTVRRDGDGTPGDGVHDVARRILQQLPPRSAVSAREVRRGTESHRQELPGGGRGGKGVRLGEPTRLPL